jgi:hypothetical protein
MRATHGGQVLVCRALPPTRVAATYAPAIRTLATHMPVTRIAG